MAFTGQQEAEIQGIFESFDLNNNGTIDKTELGLAMRSTGLNVSDAEVSKILSTFDSNHDGVIDIKEFKNIILDVQYGKYKDFGNAIDFERRMYHIKQDAANNFNKKFNQYLHPTDVKPITLPKPDSVPNYDLFKPYTFNQ